MSNVNTHHFPHRDILIVDDNMSDLKLLSGILRKAGYKVRPASDGELALRSVQARLPAMILLDVIVPGLDGYEVCRRLKDSEDTRHIPVIFISARTSPLDKVRGFGVGGVDYISKPFEAEDVLARVATHLALWKAQKETEEKNLQLEQEIAERKRAEEALRESEERYRTILESIEDGYYEVDIAGNFTFFNDSLYRSLGYPKDELMGMNSRQYMDAETARAVYQNFNAVHRTGKPAEAFDWEVIRKDGTRRFVEASVSLMRDPTGEPVGFRGLVRDITDRKRAEEALRESEEKYRSLVSNINDLVMEIDSEGNFTYVSPQIFDMFGYTQEESIGLAAFDFVHPDDIEKCMKAMETKDEVKQIEYRSRHKDGHYVHVSTSGRIISDGVGGFKIVSVLRDITDRKRAEEALREYSERLEEMVEERTQELREAQERLVRREKLAVLGQMAGGVGHELRNPLGVISNAVYFLQMAIPDADETTREYLDMISSEVRDSTKIVSDLLDFSRTRLPEREEIAVSDLVAQVLAKRPPPEDVQVTTQTPSDLPPAFVDPRQIRQVLGNLVTNGYQAMPDGGGLTITAQFVEGGTVRNPKSQIRIGVSDSGCGIPEENMEKIFEPLFTTRAKGIGLGLPLVKTLVEANGGSIEVKSEVGKGSTFTVRLPPA